jgi:uncharacterized phage-associated protein
MTNVSNEDKIVIPKSYKSVIIAKELLIRASKEQKTLTPMQLIKLVYLAHAWMLAIYSRPLISEEIEAWQYGPVIPSLYHKIKEYKGSPVEYINSEENDSIDDSSVDIIDQVYEQYGHFSGIELSMLTHEAGSPWEIAWNNEKKIISNDLITYYYRELLNKQNDKEN